LEQSYIRLGLTYKALGRRSSVLRPPGRSGTAWSAGWCPETLPCCRGNPKSY